MAMLLNSPALQTALAAGFSRSVGSFFRVQVDQKQGINAAPKTVMIEREGIMLGLTTVLSYATQLLFKTALGKQLMKSTLGMRAEPLLRALVALPGMFAAEVLSRRIAYRHASNVSSEKASSQTNLAVGSAALTSPFVPFKLLTQNPMAMAPMLLNVVSPAEFGSLPMSAATAQARHPQFNGPFYY
ncbi:MAG: hypothetical protein VKK59_01205 [Vampirovibrionales bacterium]|nr:hypothetical protein [Vampirovibrionales bacterium]